MRVYFPKYCKEYPKFSWRTLTIDSVFTDKNSNYLIIFKEIPGNRYFRFSNRKLPFTAFPRFHHGDKVKLGSLELTVKDYIWKNSDIFYSVKESNQTFHENLLKPAGYDPKRQRPCKK